MQLEFRAEQQHRDIVQLQKAVPVVGGATAAMRRFARSNNPRSILGVMLRMSLSTWVIPSISPMDRRKNPGLKHSNDIGGQVEFGACCHSCRDGRTEHFPLGEAIQEDEASRQGPNRDIEGGPGHQSRRVVPRNIN